VSEATVSHSADVRPDGTPWCEPGEERSQDRRACRVALGVAAVADVVEDNWYPSAAVGFGACHDALEVGARVPCSDGLDRADRPDALGRNCLGYGFEAAVGWSLADGTQPPRPPGGVVSAPLNDRVEARVTGAEGIRETRNREAVGGALGGGRKPDVELRLR
jgi:hypothetical protein